MKRLAENAPPPPSLARRISNWATNLFVSGLILLAGLVFGRQVLEWWRTEPTAVVMQSTGRPDNSGSSKSSLPELLESEGLEFGDFDLVLHRATAKGDIKSALAELRNRCRVEAPSETSLRRQPGPAEQALLQRLQKQKPVEQLAGAWSMYQLEGPVPIVATVREPADATKSADENAEVAVNSRRVISWGLAFPNSASPSERASAWSLFVFSEPNHSDQGEHQTSTNRPAEPEGARRLLAVQSTDGAALCAWAGKAEPQSWIEHFDRWHLETGWELNEPWTTTTSSWHRRYEHPRSGTADLQFSSVDGVLRGYWLRTPKSEP